VHCSKPTSAGRTLSHTKNSMQMKGEGSLAEMSGQECHADAKVGLRDQAVVESLLPSVDT
jgi:hypothetical protein